MSSQASPPISRVVIRKFARIVSYSIQLIPLNINGGVSSARSSGLSAQKSGAVMRLVYGARQICLERNGDTEV